MEKILYLAGPITADPNAKTSFKAAVSALENAGFIVKNPFGINPAEYFEKYAEMNEHEQNFAQLKADLIEMLYCDGVATMPLTHSSKGTARELALAFSLDMDVMPVGAWLRASITNKE